MRAISRRAYNAPSDSVTNDRRYDIDALAQYVVDGMVAEQSRLSLKSICLMQDNVGHQIGTDSDLASQIASMRLQPSPPRSRASDSPPSPPASPPQGSI